jgi:hypothetical protein
MEPQWIPSLAQVRDLRASTKKIVVYLYDAWLRDLDFVRRHRRLWSMVDHVFVSFTHSIEAYSELLECPVHYLPQAVSERWFHPYRTERPIDVLSIGRRLPDVHRQLLELSRRDDIFYFFQTARLPEAVDLRENQELLGRLCELSKVHVSWSVESTDAVRAEGGGPITARWFESAASAAVVVGRQPANAEFERLFPYDGFVREVDPASPADVERVVETAIADQSDRDERVALAEHVRTAHTWKARWREIVAVCAL